MASVTGKQIDALLPFLDRFEAADFSAGFWDTSLGPIPNFNFNEAALRFTHSLYKNGWITTSFDWPEWQESAQQFVESPQKIETADATTIRKLFTTHVRKDRFCDGHLAAMFENGHVVALLRRLTTIREGMVEQ